MSESSPDRAEGEPTAEFVPATAPPGEAATLAPRDAPATPNNAAPPGYEIVEELGRGAMGVVYKARQAGLDRDVALKRLLGGAHAGPDQLARFRSEAKAIAQLRHPNIVQIYLVGEHDGTPFFVMEFVAGGTLAGAARRGPWAPPRAAELVAKLARTMHAVHAAKIVHRDLKPGNILLDPNGEPKVADFGLAKLLDDQAAATATGAVLGTPSYMAPEQAGRRGQQIGPRTDVYALGAILYELLTGRPPFLGDTPLDTVLQVVSEDPVPPRRLRPDLPAELELICLRCLAKRADDRYPDAAALANDLERFCAGEPVSVRPPGVWRRFAKWREGRPGTTVALVIAACLWLTGAAALLLVGNYFTMLVFAAVVIAFVYPSRLMAIACGAGLAVLAGLSYAINPAVNPEHVLFTGALAGALVGGVGRAIAWARRRDVTACTLGAAYGFALGLICAGCGMPFVAAFSIGMENIEKFRAAYSREADPSENRARELVAQLNPRWPFVFTAAWALGWAVAPTALGAVVGASAAGRPSTRRPATIAQTAPPFTASAGLRKALMLGIAAAVVGTPIAAAAEFLAPPEGVAAGATLATALELAGTLALFTVLWVYLRLGREAGGADLQACSVRLAWVLLLGELFQLLHIPILTHGWQTIAGVFGVATLAVAAALCVPFVEPVVEPAGRRVVARFARLVASPVVIVATFLAVAALRVVAAAMAEGAGRVAPDVGLAWLLFLVPLLGWLAVAQIRLGDRLGRVARVVGYVELVGLIVLPIASVVAVVFFVQVMLAAISAGDPEEKFGRFLFNLYGVSAALVGGAWAVTTVLLFISALRRPRGTSEPVTTA